MIETTVITAVPVLPLAAGLLGLFVSGRARRIAAGWAIGVTSVVALLGLWAAADAFGWVGGLGIGDGRQTSFTPVTVGGIDVTVVLRVDGVSALLISSVALVALAVQVYSVEHLADDKRYAPYAATVLLFTGAMLLVVSAADLITVLVGWELMGLCSYLLIGHDRSNPAAPGAARKAFVITRIGDIGFILGVVLIGVDAGSFAFADLGAVSHGTLGVAGLLLFAGVVGKSAQFPLHTWLPDAMTGPAPVSALIHAATMVAAGVYLMARLPGVFFASEATTVVIAAVGVLSVLVGAAAAIVATDIKRVLAYSTISQLGYMVAGLAVAPGVGPSLFHLFTHAAFKALLFLCAGVVLLAVGSSALSRMGGLARSMPVTAVCSAIGLGALAGIPPLSGFWSKSGILEAAGEHLDQGGTAGFVAWIVFVGGMLGVPLTAWYCARVWFLAFAGDYRGETRGVAGVEPTLAAVRDPGYFARLPLLGLALVAALLGLLGLFGDPDSWWSVAPFHAGWPTPVAELALTALGLAVAYRSFITRSSTRALLSSDKGPSATPSDVGVTARRNSLRVAAEAGFYLDTVQRVLVAQPILALSKGARRFDEFMVDGAVRGIGRLFWAAGGATSRIHAPLSRYVSFVAGGGIALALLALLIAELR